MNKELSQTPQATTVQAKNIRKWEDNYLETQVCSFLVSMELVKSFFFKANKEFWGKPVTSKVHI